MAVVRKEINLIGSLLSVMAGVGHEIVEAAGGEVVLVDILPGHSTTSLVDRARGGKA